jgi:arabinan endo-1,5-alpha-L-arabinosidase
MNWKYSLLILRILLILLMVALMTSCTVAPSSSPSTATPLPAVAPGKIIEPAGFVKAHDPVMAKDGERYHVFTTGSRIPILCSNDMTQWEFCGRVFTENPQWVRDAIPGVTDLWAPDISFFNGKWHLYYSASTFGKNRSAIGLATNTTLNPDDPGYKWVDEGLVIESKPADTFNAIDPNVAFDAQGEPWLAWGSFWGGLKLRRLDAKTGKPADDNIIAIAGGRPGPNAIEAPFILRRGEYFFLFFSVDFCCRGADSTYNIRVGRSEKIEGPYVDKDGKPLLQGGGTPVLAGGKRWRGTGHNAIFMDNETHWLVYHAYDADEVGTAKLRIEALGWDAAGWPIAPSALIEH